MIIFHPLWRQSPVKGVRETWPWASVCTWLSRAPTRLTKKWIFMEKLMIISLRKHLTIICICLLFLFKVLLFLWYSFHPRCSEFADFSPLDGPAVPWKENAGYHRDMLGSSPSLWEEGTEMGGRFGSGRKIVICDLYLWFIACILLGAQSSQSRPGVWCPHAVLYVLSPLGGFFKDLSWD